MMNVFVAGGSGFIGTNLVKRLEKEGNIVQNLDIRNGIEYNVAYFPRIKFFMQYQDMAIHAANIPAHRLSMNDPRTVILNNYYTTLSICEAVRQSDSCNKIVFLSSFAVYGKSLPPWNEYTPLDGTTPYGLCKIQCENLLQKYHEWYGINIIIIRPSNVFGDHEELHKPLQVIPKWFDDLRCDRPLIVYGSETTRDFSFVGDIVDGIISASKKTGFEIYNLCSGEPILLKDIAEKISDKIKIVDLPDYETKEWYGSYEKAKKELGYKPTKTVWEWLDEQKREITRKKAMFEPRMRKNEDLKLHKH